MKNTNPTFVFANNFEVLTEERMKVIKGGLVPADGINTKSSVLKKENKSFNYYVVDPISSFFRGVIKGY